MALFAIEEHVAFVSPGVTAVVAGVILAAAGVAVLCWCACARKSSRIQVGRMIGGIGLLVFGLFGMQFGLRLPAFMAEQVAITNLRVLWSALELYRAEHRQYPDSLQQLVQVKLVPADLLSNSMHPATGSGECKYVYLCGVARDDPAWWPLVFEKANADNQEFTYVLFAGGSVRKVRHSIVSQTIDELKPDFKEKKGHDAVFRFPE